MSDECCMCRKERAPSAVQPQHEAPVPISTADERKVCELIPELDALEEFDRRACKKITLHKRPSESLGVALCNSSKGVFISQVVAGGRGEAAGLCTGHILRAVNEIAVYDHLVASTLVNNARGNLSLWVDPRPAERIGISMPKESNTEEKGQKSGIIHRILRLC
ncbi:hypothetical protein AB1Y20_021840 [Prymnesium parvum]|uniref:PDZ domain-containing protein n=1 Tax=Prymnesium parvum TaxID=97485 RepID=A0AB34JND9_PRYPA